MEQSIINAFTKKITDPVLLDLRQEISEKIKLTRYFKSARFDEYHTMTLSQIIRDKNPNQIYLDSFFKMLQDEIYESIASQVAQKAVEEFIQSQINRTE